MKKARLVEDHLSYEQLILDKTNFQDDEKTIS